MKCIEAEEYLSAYMESDLPAVELNRVRRHLEQCPKCAALLDAMRITVDLCRDYPEPQMDSHLLDKILTRTAGRLEPVSFYERLRRFVIQPLLTPRFAVGAGLTALFFVLMANLMLPRMSMALTSVSPSQVYTLMDRGVQHLYGEGLKAYDKKRDWQAQIAYFKDRTIHKLQFMMEKFDISDEGEKDPVAPERQEENPREKKNSGLRLMPA